MGILDYIYNTGLKQSTNLLNNTDYSTAEGLKNKIFNMKNDQLLLEKRIYYEAIFLDLSDRSGVHPQINFRTKEIKPGFLDNLSGIDRKEIIWEYDTNFDTESYFRKNWFDSSVDLHTQLKAELKSKNKL